MNSTPENKKRRGVAVYSQNPFMSMSGIKGKPRRVMSQRGNMMMVNGETGEITATSAGFWEVEEVDSSKFVKLFINGVKALQGLTGAGTKVFEVLYMKILENFGKDKIYMSFSELNQQITPMSKPTWARGMAELIEKGFIAASPMQGIFWLNPAYIWNGDRLAFVKEFRRAKTAEIRRKDTFTMELFHEGDTLPPPQPPDPARVHWWGENESDFADAPEILPDPEESPPPEGGKED